MEAADSSAPELLRTTVTGAAEAPVGRRRRKFETIALGNIEPALEGRWNVETRTGKVTVTTVFALLKKRAA